MNFLVVTPPSIYQFLFQNQLIPTCQLNDDTAALSIRELGLSASILLKCLSASVCGWECEIEKGKGWWSGFAKCLIVKKHTKIALFWSY